MDYFDLPRNKHINAFPCPIISPTPFLYKHVTFILTPPLPHISECQHLAYPSPLPRLFNIWTAPNFNILFMQLLNAGHNTRLIVDCRAGKATINLQLTLGNQPPPPPPACQVRPQPQQPGHSCLWRRECCAEARTAAANAADAPEANPSEATDILEFRTATVNATDATEAATFKKLPCRLTEDTSEK